ncbi:MAG TPA: hypothetical protein VFY85_15155 [Gemmatimonadaceae bacterium]|jgi:hypothetical protein|nr:hypothetical protein [Gemmatimonadaceae bacterium]
MRTRAITAMTALVTLVAVGACSKSDDNAAMDSTSMAPATTTTTSPGVADSSMAGMGTTTPMTHADSMRADSLRADSLKRADSTAKKP